MNGIVTMHSASLPFRPRPSTLVDPVMESMAGQAADGRWRMNRFALLHAACVVSSILLLSLCLLLELAARLSGGSFSLLAWLLLGTSGLVATYCATRLWRSWVSAKDAPLVIDRKAELQDRLATFLSAGPEAHTSRLWDYLRSENERLRPRWTPATLVPHAAPRSTWLFAVALLLSLYSVWQTTGRTLAVASRVSRAASPADAESPTPEDTTGSVADDASTGSELPRALQQALLGSKASDEMQGKAPQRTSPVQNEIAGAADVVDQNLKSPDRAERSVPAGSTRQSSPSARQEPASRAPDAGKPRDGSGAPSPSTPLRGDGPKPLAPEKGRARLPKDRTLEKKQPSPTGLGGAGSAGAGKGGDQEGLFGDRQAVGGVSGAFSLDLDARRGREDSKDAGDGTAHRVDSALSPNQRVDDAIRRAQVPAEYEGIVQRLFNRSADEAERPNATR